MTKKLPPQTAIVQLECMPAPSLSHSFTGVITGAQVQTQVHTAIPMEVTIIEVIGLMIMIIWRV